MVLKAVNNFNLNIVAGERIAIIGANGSGKSTISEIIAGIRKPTTGTIIKKDKVVIGIQFQDSRYPHGITVMDMIKYYLFSDCLFKWWNCCNGIDSK